MQESELISIGYYDQVHLSPLLPYAETSNVKLGASFDGNFLVQFIDVCGVVLKDITEFITITEFVIDGLQQFFFELLPTNFDFYKELVFIKISHFSVNLLSDLILFSSPFLISELNADEVIRFDFRNNTVNNLFDSYSIRGYFDQYDSEQQASEYTTLTGKKVSSRLIETQLEKYKIETANQLNYKTLNHILSREVVYVNGNRITNKQTNSAQERYDATCNMQPYDFTVPIDYKDFIDVTKFQTVGDFKIVSTIPIDDASISNTGAGVSLLTINFNRKVFLGAGVFKIYKTSQANLIGQFTSANFVQVSDTQLTLAIPTIFADGYYFINFPDGLFKDFYNKTLKYTTVTDWNFTIRNPHYSKLHYNSNHYST